jgi:hypothetical protein
MATVREIATYKVSGVDDGLRLITFDERGHGNVNYGYHVTTEERPPPIGGGMSSADLRKAQFMLRAVHDIRFQYGPPPIVGINGLTNEVLLAIVADRLEGFQNGSFMSAYHGNALHHVKEALRELQNRTKDRLARGVEETRTV